MKIEKPFPIPSHRSAAHRYSYPVKFHSISVFVLLFIYVCILFPFFWMCHQILRDYLQPKQQRMNKRTNENSGKHSNKIKHRKQFSYDCRSKQSNFSIKKIQYFSLAKIFRRTNLLQLQYLNVFLLRLHNLLHPNSIFKLFLRFDFFQKQIEFILGK